MMVKRFLITMLTLLLAGSVVFAAGNFSGDNPVKPRKVIQLQPLLLNPLQPVKSLNNNFPRVDAVVYNNFPTSHLSVFEMLLGRVPGVRVTGVMNFYNIRIRNAPNPPLIVIDNMPFYNSSDSELNNLLQTIPPQNVDHIEVIKNFSGAARYGSEARYGVIVIRTKGADPAPTDY
jgi:outer membrane cobalamin receptor